MSLTTQAPLTAPPEAKIDTEAFCTDDCVSPGWLHVEQIFFTASIAISVVWFFSIFSSIRSKLVGDPCVFVFFTLGTDNANRLYYMIQWTKSNTYWFLGTFLCCCVQSWSYMSRHSSSALSNVDNIQDMAFGVVITLDFMVAWLHSMISSIPDAVTQCLSTFVVDVVGIISCFLAGRVDFDLQATPEGQALFEKLKPTGDTIQTKTWFTPSFIVGFRAIIVWRRWYLGQGAGLNVLYVSFLKTVDMGITIGFSLYISAMAVSILENVGRDRRIYLDGPPFREDMLEIRQEERVSTMSPEEKKLQHNLIWTPISTLYFLFMSLLTIGPGDLFPTNIVSKVLIVAFFLYSSFHAADWVYAFRDLYRNLSARKRNYDKKKFINHVVITGNPSLQQMMDFIHEFYHEDHMEGDSANISLSKKAVTGENTELLFLLPSLVDADELERHLNLKENYRYRRVCSTYHGDVYDGLLVNHAHDCVMIFVLPNLYSKDIEKDDRHNIKRVMHLKSVMKVDMRVSLLLHLSDHRELLRSFGIPDTDVVCADEFKGSILAKSAILPGFSTFICNLFKAIGDTYGGRMENLQTSQLMPWERTYFSGLEKEVYEVDLSKAYYGLAFGEILLDTLHRSEGEVLLIGTVEYGISDLPVLRLNPGAADRVAPWVFDPNLGSGPTKRIIKGIFIAPDISTITQKLYLPGQDDQGLKERRAMLMEKKGAGKGGMDALDRRAQKLAQETAGPNTSVLQLIRRNKTGMQEELMNVQPIRDNLDDAYPGTMNQELPQVMDPVWSLGTAKELVDRREFQRILSEIHATSDLKRILGDDALQITSAEEDVLATANHRARVREYLELQQRPDISARESHVGQRDPHAPPLKLLKDGNHILLCCVTSLNYTGTVRVYPFITTLRNLSSTMLVILADRVPSDWHRILGTTNIYYVKGSPMNLLDLKRANFTHATSILILQGAVQTDLGTGDTGSSVHFADCDGIFCTKLIEANLPALSTTQVIMELLVEDNYYLVPLPARKRISSENLEMAAVTDEERTRQHRESLFRQPRYACGKLFCSGMVTSLFVNLVFNPSLVALVNALISSRGITIRVLRNWVGMPYLNMLESLIWYHDLLPIGIARLIDFEKTSERKNFSPFERPAEQKKSAMQEIQNSLQSRFIITAPHAMDELLHADDVVICLVKTEGESH